MLRVSVGSGMAAVGYLLLYCAVTAGGTFALRPWDALSPSAPWPVQGGGSSGSSGSGGSGGLLGVARRIIGLIPGVGGLLGGL